MSTVELTNVGPIEKLALPCPDNGGVVVLRGRNGVGKTSALNAVNKLLTGRGDVSLRDGELKGGVAGFGAKLTVGKSTRGDRSELEVVTLGSDLSAADLVDPGVADPVAADAKRIRALIQLTGQPAEASDFYALIGGQAEFERLLPGVDIDEDDPLKLSSKIKRELERLARESERERDAARGKAELAGEFIEQAAGTETIETDADVLHSRLEQAVSNKSAIDARIEASRQSREAAAQARQSLDEFKDDVTRWGVPEATNEHARRKLAYQNASNALETARKRYEQANKELQEADAWLEQAQRDAKLIAGWEQAIAAGEVALPSDTDIGRAAQAVADARDAIEKAAVARKAREQVADAERFTRLANSWNDDAARLRKAAGSVDTVLSGMVAKVGADLFVSGDRLCTNTDRGKTCFADLSHGERWKAAIDVCVDAVGATGVLVIPQDAWESLDPINREAIAEHARRRGVLVITAEATSDEEIVAEAY